MAYRHPEHPIKLYQHPYSGHCHRVQLFLSLLELPHELILVDLLKGEQKTEAFLRLNPFGEVPVMDDNGFVLADSNAILVYLAGQYGDGEWLPGGPHRVAQVQRWLSVAAGSLVAGPGLARLGNVFNKPINKDEAVRKAGQLLAVMDKTLTAQPYLIGATPTIADLALYTYTAHAPEGDIALTPYPQVEAWLARVEALPGFVPMNRSPVGLFANTGT